MTLLASVHIHSDTGYAQSIRAGRHTLIADEPEALGGADLGPSPFQLVLSGLGACTAITLEMYARRKHWTLGPLQIELRMFEQEQTQRVARVISFDPAVSDEQRARLLEIADKTPVTKALRAGFAISTSATPR
jgi:putative redox protein